MNVIFDSRFSKSIDKLKVESVKLEVIKFIELAESVNNLKELSNIKKTKRFQGILSI
jgi:hypothetical protein